MKNLCTETIYEGISIFPTKKQELELWSFLFYASVISKQHNERHFNSTNILEKFSPDVGQMACAHCQLVYKKNIAIAMVLNSILTVCHCFVSMTRESGIHPVWNRAHELSSLQCKHSSWRNESQRGRHEEVRWHEADPSHDQTLCHYLGKE